MSENTEDSPKALSISGNVFIYGTLATLLVAVVCAASLLSFSVYSVYRERDMALQVAASTQVLNKCVIEKAAYTGRLKTFEALFIHSKKTAVDAAIREFIDHAGSGVKTSELTIAQYKDWLRER